jgi:hypothetical protein
MRRHGNFSLSSAIVALGKAFAECRQKTLGKEIFTNEILAVYSLPSAALGKGFAEGKMAKHAYPVVNTPTGVHLKYAALKFWFS